MAIRKPHAFMAMAFGTKPGPDGRTPVDFNDLRTRLFKPALEQSGFVAFRADAEQRAGDIRVDPLQELLAADLVLVDLTIANPNVWYELGVRRALRERGVVLAYGVWRDARRRGPQGLRRVLRPQGALPARRRRPTAGRGSSAGRRCGRR